VQLLPGLRHHQLPLSAVLTQLAPSCRRPLIEVASGDVIAIETTAGGARHDAERMISGDAALERIFSAPHDVRPLTGPVAVRGALPGDVVELRIIDVRLRPSANPNYRGRSFGCQVGHETLTATTYELNADESCGVARAIRQVGGQQEILQRLRIPLRAHFGLITLAAPQEPTGATLGAMISDARAGKGAVLFLPVQVRGALLSIGEPRAAAAIECSLTGVFQLILHKGQGALQPLLETSDEWVASAQTDDPATLDRTAAQLCRKMVQTLASVKAVPEGEARALMSAAADISAKRTESGWRVTAALNKSLLAPARVAED
jgi:acetamidase/formamidase